MRNSRAAEGTVKQGQRYLADLLFPDRGDAAEFEPLNVPPDQRRLLTDTFDFTVSTVVSALDEGNIFIPSFQRHYVWSLTQASRLIESLIIQCPIPSIYLNEEPDDRLTVIDGNQRLISIYNYIKGNFLLEGLTTYPDLNGYRFSSLDARFQRHISSRPLRFISIKKETHPQIKFDVFERINSGAVKLNSQELRHGIYYGPLMKRVDELAVASFWKELASQGKDQRMRSSELILRFWALRYELASYKKPLESFLNDFAKRHRSEDRTRLDEWSDELSAVAAIIARLFGNFAFRSVDRRGHITKLINSALFDAEMVGVARFEDRDYLANYEPTRFQEQLRNFLVQDEDFRKAVSAATSDERSVQARIDRFEYFLTLL